MSKTNRNHILFILFLLTVSVKLSAIHPDSILNGVRISPKLRYGFIYPHHSAIAYILDGNISAFELAISTSARGKHFYEQLYRSPSYGIAYGYFNFSNPNVLGQAHAVFGFFEAPLAGNENRLQFLYRIDLGCGFINKTFDSDYNPLNLAVSSHLNVYVGFGFQTRYRLNSNKHLNFGLEASHFSNGKFKSPNLGLNALQASVALAFDVIPAIKPDYSKTDRRYTKQFFDINLNTGFKRDDMLNEQLYHTASIIADYWYSFSPKYAVGAGADFFYDESLGFTKEYEEEIPATPSDNYQAGLHLGLMARYNNIALYLNSGYYIWADYHKYSTFYNRLGLRYAINGKVTINASLKAHYAIADFIEWGVGYRFSIQ